MSPKSFPLLSLVALLVLVCTLALQPQVAARPDPYYPTECNLLGSTTYVSGELTNLHSENGVYMTFGSYASETSTQTLYAHRETTTIGSTSYNLSRLEAADTVGESLSVSTASTGRKLWGKFVYPLTGVASIPASTLTFYYRTWHSNALPEDVLTNSPSFVPTVLWGNAENAYSSDDAYAETDVPNQAQRYGNYGFNIPVNAIIRKVEVGYEAYTDGDEKIEITLSWNGGSQWATEYVSPPLGTTDPDTATWVDFTSVTNWTANKLSNPNFYVRANGIRTGSTMDFVFLDWIPVRVTYVEPPSARADVDILIRKSDGTIRQTLATNAASSANLAIAAQTLSGVYSWSAYIVVDETDYLEIDYYLDVTTAMAGITAYLRIDDNTLVTVDQTRTAGIMLPSEYTTEVEFTGSSDIDSWSLLAWTVDSAWTTGGVSVTLKIHNYTLGAYPTSGNGYIAYTSSATSDTDETKNQTVTTNLADFRDGLGNWKMKIKGIKSTTSQFDLKIDIIVYEVFSAPLHDVSVLNVTTPLNSAYSGEIVTVNVTVRNEGGTTETFNVTLYYESTEIGKQTVLTLAPSSSTTITFNWNTTEVVPGTYTIKAVAEAVPGEIDLSGNTFSLGTIEILQSGSTATPPSILPYIFLIGIAVTGVISGIILNKKRVGSKFVGFEFFNDMIGGGIPVGSSTLIIGGPALGKSILCQQLAHKYLTEKKACIFISYDNFPSKIRENMKNFSWDLSMYEQEGAFTFIDCYSAVAGTPSQERHAVNQPFALTELSIATSAALDGITDMPKAMFFDSATSLFTNLDASRVITFLQDRGARIKANNGIFVFTVAKGTIAPNFMNRLMEVVDCVIELEVCEEQGKSFRRMRVTKLRGQAHLDEWVMFKIKPKHGLVFLRPRKVK